MEPRLHRALASFALAITLFATGACGGGDDAGAGGGGPVDVYVTAVTTADGAVTARFVAGDLPASTGGPTLAMTTNPAVIPGGTAPASLTADAAFATIVIGIEGLDGHYVLELPAATSTTELILRLSQDIDIDAFDWIVGVGGGGRFGDFVTVPVDVIAVGTGDVQVSLAWDTSADVDLHVFDPAGDEIYYARRASASGGALDLDSNAGCGSDGPRNENITWPTGRAPAGTYRVAVDYWSSCGEPRTNYAVAIHVAGAAPLTFAGELTGDGDGGGANAGVPIATFTVGGAARAAEPPAVQPLGAVRVDVAPGATIHAK